MIKKARFRISNLQRGIEFIRYSDFRRKVGAYKEEYAKPEPIAIQSDMMKKEDLAFDSLCRDRAVESLLHSGKYHIGRIGVLLNPFAYAPQAAVLLLAFKMPVRIGIKVTSSRNKEYEDISSLKKYHRISITGLETGKNWIELTVYDENNKIQKKRRFFIWSEIPEMEPKPIVKTELTGGSAYDRIFVTGGEINPFVFNADGSVFHYMKLKNLRTTTYGVYPIEKSNFLWFLRSTGVPTFANPHSCLGYEMDFMGRIKRTYHVKKGLHHYVCQLPNGNLVAVSNSIEGHTEDTLIEIERRTGKILRSIYFRDIFGNKLIDQIDWVHANALEYIEEEDSMLICFRNIHSVIKLNWTTLQVIWLMSYPDLWEDTPLKDKLLVPQGKVHYSFQAHAAHEITDLPDMEEGLRYYLIFDNHCRHRRPIEGMELKPPFSYICIYGVNEKDMTVKEVKRIRIEKSIVRSNAEYDGSTKRLFNMSGCMAHSNEEYRGKIEEYDYESDKVLNTWYIGSDFFSAYSFEWHSDDYCKPTGLNKTYQYVCGEADELVTSVPRGKEVAALVDEECFSRQYIEGERFYFFTKDHSISSLMLVGEKYCYERDYTDTWQTNEIHENRRYYCVVSLRGLPEDTYKVKVLCEDTLYETGHYIKIGE